MTITIDAGNSAVKVALLIDHRVAATERIATDDAAARGQLGVRLQALLAREHDEAPDRTRSRRGIVLVSVVPAWTEAVMHAAVRAAVPLLLADHGSIPIEARLPHPERIGSDRLINAYAVARLHGTPAIVVDLGTATTVDAVDGGGAFLGGAILPGVELGLRALAGGTALLPDVDPVAPRQAIGCDTGEAIRSGVVFGHVGAVRELVMRMTAELGPHEKPHVVVTGGFSAAPWAGLFVDSGGPAAAIADLLDPQLTLRGLGLLHDELAQMHA
jgi:type III pantothenate kinase